MKKHLLAFILCFATLYLYSQTGKSAIVEALNRRIDDAVVQKDLPQLQRWYADDFIFTHGTGVVDDKNSWLKTVADPAARYLSRTHDSLTTELHQHVAIVHGKLTVSRENTGRPANYELWYLRVFALRKKQWQLVSHRTISERHLN